MIDPKDNSTQPLDLGEAKRRRGRPSTGKAMSNAERQRAYRERAKAQRNEKTENGTDLVSRAKYEKLHAITIEISDRCALAEHHRDELHEQVQKLLEQRDSLIRECHELKKELASRNEKEITNGKIPGTWIVERKERGTKKWEKSGDAPESSWDAAKGSVDYMQF
ncbi:hypothetical protein M8R19_33060, partial [Pseudomonas sp. R3.Fl]|nr:hypothetical protein [Pseudomonas sp. R3.Fl]